MQQESLPPPTNEMINYFVTNLPDKWNMLKWGIRFALEGKVLGNPKDRFQFVVTRMTPDGFAEGFSVNLN